MDTRFLEQMDNLTEEEQFEIFMQQPAIQVLQAIEALPYSVIEEGTEAIMEFFKQYFNDPTLSAYLDDEIKKRLQHHKK